MSSDLELTLTSHELFGLPADTAATGQAFRVEVTPPDRPPFFALARLVVVYTNMNARNHLCVFFRDEKGIEEELFCGAVFGKHDIEEASTEGDCFRLIVEGANQETLTRFWKSRELPYGLRLSSEGFGRVITPGMLLDSTKDFRWGSEEGSQFFEWNTSDFHGFCERLVEDPASELNVFFDWQKLSPEEKTDFVTRCVCGDWENMVQLFEWVLQLVTHHYGAYPYGEDTGSYWGFLNTEYKAKHPGVHFMRRWRNAILNIIRPSFWPDEPLCRTKWRNRYTNLEREVTCTTPTAHEVVEARLGLQEFLQPHLSASEIEALFIP